MAVTAGNDGKIIIGASGEVVNVRSWSVEESAATVETTKMGDSEASFVKTFTSWTASCDVLWDHSDTDGQVALANGSSVTFKAYPQGNATDDWFYSGSAIVTGHNRSASYDGLVEASITLQGTGALTAAQVQ